jgi:hypothetical protein
VRTGVRTIIEASEKKAFRRIFGPKRDEVTGGWRKLHDDKVYNLYSFIG